MWYSSTCCLFYKQFYEMDVLFNMKKWFVAAASVLMTLSLAACGSKTVATTSGGKVTESEYYSSLKKTSSGKQVLQEMILNKILDKEYGDKVTDKKSMLNTTSTRSNTALHFQPFLHKIIIRNLHSRRTFALRCFCMKLS